MLRIAAIGLQRGAAMSGGGFDWKLRRHDVGRNADSIGTTLVTSGPLRIPVARVQQSCAAILGGRSRFRDLASAAFRVEDRGRAGCR